MSRDALPIADDSSEGERESQLSRRRFYLLLFGWLGTLSSMLAASAAALRGLVPNLLDEPDLRYRAGSPDDYVDGADELVPDIRTFVERRGNGYRAMSAVCTHLGCTVNSAGPGASGFRCPCHGSAFDEDGQVLHGPAPAPLPFFALDLSRDGRLVIDREREVGSDRYLVLESGSGASAREGEA